MPRLTIDGQTVDVAAGRSVLEAARDAGITIPTLCYHKDLSVDGSCRLCMVEVENMHGQAAACMLPVSEGMVVPPETPALAESRRFTLEMLLKRFADAGYAKGDRDETEFEHWVRRYGARLCLRVESGGSPVQRFPVNSD